MMYKFIGGDQREYGPVSADEIRAWIAQGRASGATRVQADASTDWLPLSALPEFADALAAQADELQARALPQPALDPATQVDFYSARAANLDIARCLQRSWALLQQHVWRIIGPSAVVLLITLLLDLVPLIGTAANAVFGLALWGGLDWLFLKLVRGQPADFPDVFTGFQIQFVPLMLAGIVSTVLIFLGFLLCILPGIYLLVAWLGFTPLLIIDKRMDFWPALELSRKVVTNNWWIIFGLFVLTGILFLAGFVVLIVGVFITLPLATGAVVYAYQDIFGDAPSGTA